jgi:hypothetical protein
VAGGKQKGSHGTSYLSLTYMHVCACCTRRPQPSPLQTGRAALRVDSNRTAAVGYDDYSFDDSAYDSYFYEAADYYEQYVQTIPVGHDYSNDADSAFDTSISEAADYMQPIPAGHDFSIDEGAASAHLRGAQPLPATGPTAQQGPP